MGPARELEKDTPCEDLESDSDSDSDDRNTSDSGYKKQEAAFEEERSTIAELDAKRVEDGRREKPFALAFSGGGIRAAAFQAGVLWRLAQANRLKDVEYFAAVSGGGYITTAFASHCVEAYEKAGNRGPEPGQVRGWYLEVVAKTLCRMQENAGNFVRDCVRDPGGPTDGNGLLPRAFDLPILLGMLLVTLMVSPLMLFCLIATVAFNVDMMWGAPMRVAFCSRDSASWRMVFHSDPRFRLIVWAVCALLGMQLVFFGLRPCFRLTAKKGGPEPEDWKPGQERPKAGRLYLFGHATGAMLLRIGIVLVLSTTVPVAVCILEKIEYDNGEGHHVRVRQCSAYLAAELKKEGSHEREYINGLLETYGCNNTAESPNPTRYGKKEYGKHWVCGLAFYNETDAGSVSEPPKREPQKVLAAVGLALAASVTVLFIILPLIGAKLFFSVLAVVGPLMFGFLVVQFSQIAVYARITKNSRGILSWRQEDWDMVVHVAIWFFLLVLPVYEKMRALFHFYYMRTLQSNFFAKGSASDLRIQDLLEHPYIPFILLTGTSTDFQPPGDKDTISELSFTPLHCGGEETGYVGMPKDMTLAKTAALSGAGCLDAITLAMNSDNIIMRVYLEVLNLSWGDYIVFEPLAGRDSKERRRRKVLRECAGAAVWIAVFALQLAGYYFRDLYPHRAYDFVLVSRILVVATFTLSFYNYVPWVQTITLSAMVRLFHQTTSYFCVAEKPPAMLYVTDGGVRDCTTICQLLARRSERILLVLANADPQDELTVLRTAIDVARELRLAHFYDPDDSTRCLDLTFERYKEDVDKEGFLRLGISYCFDEVPKHGLLIVVKNRLPKSQADKPVRPLLTREEIIAGEGTDDSSSDLEARSSDLEAFPETAAELGSLGCCDCCHTHKLNCGAKFPHGTGANYLYLTPQFCNNLMRLGHDISGVAVEAIASDPLPTPVRAAGP